MGYIYKISNDINNKVYIGQTIKTIQKRQQQHINDAQLNEKKSFHLYNAINKYGVEHFKIEQIEECSDELLNEREIYQISYYDSYRNGYNMTLGGEGCLYDIDTQQIYNLQDQGYGIKEIAEKLEVSRMVIRNRIYNYKNYSQEEAIKRGIKKSNNRKYKITYQQSLEGELINTYNSQQEAGKAINKSNKAISYAIRTGGTSGGFLQTDSLCPPKSKTKLKTKQVGQYNLNGELIKIYNSRKDAALAVDCDPSSIGQCCNGRIKTVKGYIQKNIEGEN